MVDLAGKELRLDEPRRRRARPPGTERYRSAASSAGAASDFGSAAKYTQTSPSCSRTGYDRTRMRETSMSSPAAWRGYACSTPSRQTASRDRALDRLLAYPPGGERRCPVRTDVAHREDLARLHAAEQHRLAAQHLAAHGARSQRGREPGHVPEIGQEHRCFGQNACAALVTRVDSSGCARTHPGCDDRIVAQPPTGFSSVSRVAVIWFALNSSIL